MHHAYGVPFEDISLDRAFPTPERASVAKTFDYMQWLIDERSVGARSRQIALHGIMQGAKFLFHSMSKVNPHAGKWQFCAYNLLHIMYLHLNFHSRRICLQRHRGGPRTQSYASGFKA